MRRWLLRAWLISAVVSWCLSGCKSSAPKQAYPNDPLLVSKKPVEGKLNQGQGKPQALVRAEPAMPPLPIEALVPQPAPAASLPIVRAQMSDQARN